MLAGGAVRLPLAHLSARVAWHDTDWTGRVCGAPSANHSCTILKNVKERKDADVEDADAGVSWAELPRERVPPCVFERGGFMRPNAFTIERDHAYAGGRNPSHAHFARTPHRMAPYTIEATPYRWVMREEAPRLNDVWGIVYDAELERQADTHMQWKETNWVQDHRNQLALLDSFFSALVPGKSLVLLYAKDLPLLEERGPGARILVGAGIVREVAPSVEWDYTGPGPLRSIMWERSIAHSIRSSFDDGFLLPYQQLLNNPNLVGEDLSRFVALAPADHFDEFSYVSEHVGHDGAIAALLELTRVVGEVRGVADGPWEKVATWLSNQIADAWTLRGPFPGLGSALTAAGMERGALVAHAVTESLDSGSFDPWPALAAAIADAPSGRGPAAGLVGRMALKAWDRVVADKERFALLRLLARFSFTTAQARRLFDRDERERTGVQVKDEELLENPYRIFELERGRRDAISFQTLDRGIFPRDAGARSALDRDPLPQPIEEAADDRRVRAACVDVLERAAADGHTLLDEPGLRRRLSSLEVDPACDPTSDLFALAATEFPPVLFERPLAQGTSRGWQLARLAEATGLIVADVAARIDAGPIDVAWNWREAIDAVIDEPIDPQDENEELARAEKAVALEILARSRVSALVGPAGTGKTTMLRALCSQPEIKGRGVLLLAPTGKARVQLGDKAGAKALTLAQFLRRSGRWDEEFGYRAKPEGKREGAFATVVVDESSMLTEEMLAALVASTTGVERLVLCGDHRQLPPIGPGRPFSDLVYYLRDHLADSAQASGKTGGGLAELTIGRRQTPIGSGSGTKTVAGRDDLAVASWFSVDGVSPAADEAFARVLSGRGDGTLTIVSWKDEDDLHSKLVEYLSNDPDLNVLAGDGDALKRSLGAAGTYSGRASFEYGNGSSGAEFWQILSPVRSRPGGVTGLNRMIRKRWRSGDATLARKSYKLPPPLGADEILFHDKVICIHNHPRQGWDFAARQKLDGDVANGEIGIAVGWMTHKGLKVEFSTQPGLQFTFWTSDLNSDRERQTELLELAYAVTVHKAQGSQFGTTLVVVPNPCPLLSPELLYTALTRQRQRAVLFVQGDPQELRALASPWQSETARRLTCLFRPADPFQTPEGKVLDGSHVHRTANGEMVRSKSEVIVANTLRSLGVEYLYEEPLRMPDGSWRLPDFTISRPGRPTVFWEHLGMLDKAGYRADWEAKLEWYRSHDVLPWTEASPTAAVLVWSAEGQLRAGIDAADIESRAREVFGRASASAR